MSAAAVLPIPSGGSALAATPEAEQPTERTDQHRQGCRKRYGIDLTEQPVQLVTNARGEVDVILVASGATVARQQRPQVGNGDQLAVLISQRAEQLARVRVECIDVAEVLMEVPHQQRARELAETFGGDCQAPRRRYDTDINETPDERAVRLEYAHEPRAFRRLVCSRSADG